MSTKKELKEKLVDEHGAVPRGTDPLVRRRSAETIHVAAAASTRP